MTDQEINSESPAKFIAMLMERACKDLKGAAAALNSEREEERVEGRRLIVHAQMIIKELKASLNLREDLARNLQRLYEYMEFALGEAIQKKSPERVIEVHELLFEIYSAWKDTATKGA